MYRVEKCPNLGAVVPNTILPHPTGKSNRALLRAWASALLVGAAVCLTLVAAFAGLGALKPLAAASMLLWVLLNLTLTTLTERIFLGIATAAAIGVVVFIAEPGRVLLQALDRANLLFAFVISLNFLRDAAQSSVAVRRAGHFLIAQSPPRRYAALTLGAHVFGIVLNLGAVNMLGALVRRSNTLAAAGGDPRIVKIRAQRMTTALVRGFCAMLMWSPMGISVALTLSLVPTLTWFDIGPPAAAGAIAFMAIGWVIDRLDWPPALRRAPPRLAPPPPARDVLPMLGITVILVAGVLATKLVLGSSLLIAVMTAVPLMALVWIGLQYRRGGVRLMAAAVGRRLRRHVMGHLAQARPEAVVMLSAAFMGVALAALLDVGEAMKWLAAQGASPAWLAITVFAAIVLAAQLSISPIVAATIMGLAVAHLDPPVLPPLALALALQMGWSLAAVTSPYSGGMLLLARVVGERPLMIQLWNLKYAAVCSALVALGFFLWL